MNIIYYADRGSMGDLSDSEYEAFCEWAKDSIQREFPRCTVFIRNEQNYNRYADIENFDSSVWSCDDYDNLINEINDFCWRLWEECPWCGRFFEQIA
jgi:hypothetical protein